jgi:transcriptional regulator with XRE-family HTH domain
MRPEELAQALTAQRKQLHITQQQVADRMGKHLSFVQGIEYNPGVNRKIETYIAYAEAIGMKLVFTLD